MKKGMDELLCTQTKPKLDLTGLAAIESLWPINHAKAT